MLSSGGSLAGPPRRDWPQLRGVNRDGIAPDARILDRWPEAGPKEVWRIPLGAGFSGMAVVGGRVFTMDSRGQDEFAVCLRADNGQELWRTRVGTIFREYWGDGPRSTPTVDGDTVYVLSARGNLAALRTRNGQPLWEVDFRERFKSKTPEWGFAASPLVLGDLLVVETGGENEAPIVALDKRTGKVHWMSHVDRTAYSSPIVITFDWNKVLVFMTAANVLAMNPAGKVLWRVPFEPEKEIKPAMPVFIPPDLIFVSASYDVGALALRLIPANGSVGVHEIWRTRVMKNHFNASVALDGHLYGFDNATLKCIEAASGRQRWAKRGGLGKGSLIYADGHLIVLSESGRLLLVEATPEAYREKGRVQVLRGRSWTSPTFADGRLYVRNLEELVSLDLAVGAVRARRAPCERE